MTFKPFDFQKNGDLSKRTSWLVGGPADFFIEPQTIEELSLIQSEAQSRGLPVTVIGGGSNILVSDKGVRGLVVSLSKLNGIEVLEDKNHLSLWVKAGTPKSQLLKIFLKYKLEAACFLAGIPGQVGGGVVMNAGVGEKFKPREFCEITSAVEILRPNGNLETILGESLTWGYRHCQGWQPGIITRVKVQAPLEPKENIPRLVKDLNQTRLKKQPLEWPSCGSVFRNPLPRHAGQLIEASGLKGYKVGGAQISEKHANFILNLGGAKASEIKFLIDLCIDEVRRQHHVEIKTEVIFLGDFETTP